MEPRNAMEAARCVLSGWNVCDVFRRWKEEWTRCPVRDKRRRRGGVCLAGVVWSGVAKGKGSPKSLKFCEDAGRERSAVMSEGSKQGK
eukprot:6130031-Pleurochrysis_carterae.AAC.2